MKRRSGKIFAATLALLVCLNAMPLGTLAAEETSGTPETEQTVGITTPTEGEGATSLIVGAETDKEGDDQSDVDKGTGTTAGDGEGTGDATGTGEETTATTDDNKDNDEIVDDNGTEEGSVIGEGTDGEGSPDLNADGNATGDEILDGDDNEDENSSTTPDGADDPNPAAPANDTTNTLSNARRIAPAAQLLADTEATVYYVGGDDADDGNTGTSTDEAFATLKQAMSVAKDGSTIYLLSNLTMTELARVDHKSITIDGQNHTIYRGDGFTPWNDQQRGGYNPELIEVANQSTLTLVNITLDDLNKTEGTVYAEQITGDGDKKNEEKVQGAMIVAFGDGGGTIVLGDKTTLKNFGGMSAVRIGGVGDSKSTLIMKSGSTITDDASVMNGDRKGGFAAVWNQGGTIIMEENSSISNVDGRAIYCEDGGTAEINGTISDITPNKTMKECTGASNGGFGGLAIYAKPNTAKITLGATGKIFDIKSDNAADVAIMLVDGTFEMLKGSSITNISTIGLIDCNGGTMNINGTISDCHTGKVFFRMRGSKSTFVLGEDGIITNCSTTDAGIVYVNQGQSHITLSGTISNISDGDAIFISPNQPSDGSECIVTETAVIQNVAADAIKSHNRSRTTISGKIIDCDGYAVSYGFMRGSNLDITDSAVIQGNNNGKAQVCLTQKDDNTIAATDINQHMSIAPDTLIGNQSVVTPFGTITLDPDYDAIGLGKASTAAVEEINDQVRSEKEREDWEVAGNALWFQPTESTLHFTVARPTSVEQGIGLHVGYIPLGEDGNPEPDAELKLLQLTNSETIDVNLTGLEPNQSYALAFVVESKYYVTITPADITVYMGGTEGYEGTVASDGTIQGSSSLPEPGFKVDLPEGVDPEDVTITTTPAAGAPETWTFEPYSENDAGEAVDDIYKIVSTSTTDEVKSPRMKFTNVAGVVVTSDDFDVGANVNQTLTMEIYKNEDTEVEAKPNDQQDVTYGVIANSGKLLVRGTTDNAKYGVLNADLETGLPGVKADDGVTFTINDSDIPANGTIALLFDNIIENTNSETNRTSLLTKRADERLSELNETIPAGMVRNYQFKYLDLVDTSNGNAWVDAQDGSGKPVAVTVCWPYPAGTDENTKFTVLHFKDLHREMDSNQVAGQIADCDVEIIDEGSIKLTDTHIEFKTTEFSPFALVWYTPKPATPTVEEETSDNGSTTTTTPAATPAPTAQPAAQTTAAAAAPTAAIPQTSDESHPALWAGVLVFSGAALAALYLLKRRKQNRER